MLVLVAAAAAATAAATSSRSLRGRLGGSSAAAQQPAAGSPWPSSLSFTAQPPLATESHWSAPAEEWSRERVDWRHERLERSQALHRSLEDALADDVPDTWLWRNLSGNASEASDELPPGFWESVCRGTISASTNASSNATADRPMEDWNVVRNVTCSEHLDGEFADEAAALEACGGLCGAVYDVGCQRQKFGLCKVGALEQESPVGSCLRYRLPGHLVPGQGAQEPHKELSEFWKTLCEEGSTTGFRLLFHKRLCAAGTVLADAPTESRCAELARADASCSTVFDFDGGSPPACRCVAKNAACQAPVPDGDASSERNVFILS